MVRSARVNRAAAQARRFSAKWRSASETAALDRRDEEGRRHNAHFRCDWPRRHAGRWHTEYRGLRYETASRAVVVGERCRGRGVIVSVAQVSEMIVMRCRVVGMLAAKHVAVLMCVRVVMRVTMQRAAQRTGQKIGQAGN